MITTILFDLDGTLLPMNQEEFIADYLNRMAARLSPYGYDAAKLAKTIWKGTAAMAQNDGSATNAEVFWAQFETVFGEGSRKDEPLFEAFYHTDFQLVQKSCGFAPEAAVVIRRVRELGYRVALATNPLFPAIATLSRTRWAGLNPTDFELITTYEESLHSKPNPDYYRDVVNTLGVRPEECVMVGNDVSEDMVAKELGMQVFLLTDCIINKHNQDISVYPHGGFPELMAFIERLNK